MSTLLNALIEPMLRCADGGLDFDFSYLISR